MHTNASPWTRSLSENTISPHLAHGFASKIPFLAGNGYSTTGPIARNCSSGSPAIFSTRGSVILRIDVLGKDSRLALADERTFERGREKRRLQRHAHGLLLPASIKVNAILW